MSEALGGVTLKDLLFEGKHLSSKVESAVTSAGVTRSIDGATVLRVGLHDAHRVLLRTGLLSEAITAQVDEYDFRLVAVNKGGPSIEATFEALAVAALREHKDPRKIAPGQMTRPDFARMLVSEEPWIKFESGGPSEVTKVELARGKIDLAPGEEQEDTWAALGRLADEVAWRRWEDRAVVKFMADSFLEAQEVAYRIKENTGPVGTIGFDHDVGKPVATMRVEVNAARWSVPLGALVEVEGEGPGDGKWLLSEIDKPLSRVQAMLTLIRSRPTLPEPEPDTTDLPDSDDAEGGGDASTPTGSGESGNGFIWPVRGTITSGYGQRNGRLHAGIDIGVAQGTKVKAARGGVVAHAGSAGGYGYAVYLSHDNGKVVTRYGHLSRIDCKRGQQVDQGAVIGLSGGRKGSVGAGNSSGPHLHFEIRPSDRPANPRKYLS